MKKFLLLLFTLIVSVSANILSDINSIESDFIQNITNENNKTIRYEGKFYAKKDGKALWIYQKPIQKRLYFINNQVIIIEPALEQAVFSKINNFPKILDILKRAKKEKEYFLAKCCNRSYKIYTKKDKIYKIIYMDKVGNRVVIKFFNENINIIIDNSIFKYDIPEDYDILRN